MAANTSVEDGMLETAKILLGHGWSSEVLQAIVESRARLGPCLAAAFNGSAARRPDALALVDDAGTMTFAELDDRILRTATGLSRIGVGPGSRVGLLARNHRGFVVAAAAASVLRARVIYLHTGSGPAELARVVMRERAEVLIYDSDLADALREVPSTVRRLVSTPPGEASTTSWLASVEELASCNRPLDRAPSLGSADSVILTSGTTGQPRGALRRGSPSGVAFANMLGRFPVRLDGTALIAAPLFHAWGQGVLQIAAVASNALVLRRRFDPAGVLADVERQCVDLLAVTPVMLRRMLELPEETRSGFDTASLRITASSGARLPGDLAARWMDAFGDNLYSFYGSTELHVVSFATPAELRDAPGTAGRAAAGVDVRIIDDRGHEVGAGVVGRVVVRSPTRFTGYTDGSSGGTHQDMLITRDVGYIDARGLLFVEGREDDVIISGGENVLPAEVEDVLGRHPDVAEAVVIGVPDRDFGERLHAFVVPRPGAEPLGADLEAYIRERLARHKVPREIELVPELPKTETGKVLRRLLHRRDRS